MRRYTISVNNTSKVVDVEVVGANLFRVLIDGRLVDVTLDDHRDLGHGAITPAVTPRVTHDIAGGSAAHGASAPAGPPPTPSAQQAAAPAPAPATASAAAATAPAGGGRNKMTAPMPGVILTIDTTVGATVKRGDALLVLEAMKMKNELRAPRDGVVAEIYVAPNQQVKFGETLVRFEA